MSRVTFFGSQAIRFDHVISGPYCRNSEHDLVDTGLVQVSAPIRQHGDALARASQPQVDFARKGTR